MAGVHGRLQIAANRYPLTTVRINHSIKVRLDEVIVQSEHGGGGGAGAPGTLTSPANTGIDRARTNKIGKSLRMSGSPSSRVKLLNS